MYCYIPALVFYLSFMFLSWEMYYLTNIQTLDAVVLFVPLMNELTLFPISTRDCWHVRSPNTLVLVMYHRGVGVYRLSFSHYPIRTKWIISIHCLDVFVFLTHVSNPTSHLCHHHTTSHNKDTHMLEFDYVQMSVSPAVWPSMYIAHFYIHLYKVIFTDGYDFHEIM